MIYLFQSLILWTIFFNFWGTRIPQLSFYDEFIALFLIIYIVIKLFFQTRVIKRQHIILLYIFISLILIVYFSILSLIINNSPITNMLLFVFGVTKTLIIIIAAYLSKINIYDFIKKYIKILKIIFQVCLLFIIFDCIDHFLIGNNSIFIPDWTGNIFISSHTLCAISLILFMDNSYRSLYLFNKIGLKSIIYLLIAMIAAHWSIILLFLPLYFIMLIRSKLIKIYRPKWIVLFLFLMLYSYNMLYKEYSGFFQNYIVFLKHLPQIDYWYTIATNNIINLQFILFGVGPGMAGSPTADKFNTDFFINYFYPYVSYYKELTNVTGLFTQPFSSFNTIISDVGISVYIIITLLFIVVSYKSYFIINTNINLNLKFVNCFLFIVFTMTIIRSLLISSYYGGGETLLYTACIILGLLHQSSNSKLQYE